MRKLAVGLAWGVVLSLAFSAGPADPLTPRTSVSCAPGFQPFGPQCVSNERVYDENLWGQVVREDGRP